MKIFVDSRHTLILESLTALLDQHHDAVHLDEAEVALQDLCGHTAPYPEPPSIPTLALIHSDSEDGTGLEVLRSGYRGYIHTGEGTQQLNKALHALLQGETWAERHVLLQLLDNPNPSSLTKREQEVYELVVQGMSNKQIAVQLELSVNTVKVYVSKVLQKNDKHRRGELIVLNNASRA